MIDCDRIVAILGVEGYTLISSVTNYGDNVAAEFRGASFVAMGESFAASPVLQTYCRDPMPNVGEIMGVKLTQRTGNTGLERGTYPNKPEWNYDRPSGSVSTGSEEFLIINTRSGPDYALPGISPVSTVTPIATTKPGIVDRDFRVWIGSRVAITEWIRQNSQVIDVNQSFTNFSGGQSTNIAYQYQGWKMLCSFPYEALLAYPFCGGVIRGRESEGPKFVNLCEDDLGFCNEPKCCDCCDIARSVLAIFGEPIAA